MTLSHDEAVKVDPSIWRRLKPFAATDFKGPLPSAELCRTESMSDVEAEQLKEKDREWALEDAKRPIPKSWAVLKKSTHPDDVLMAKRIPEMDWEHACVDWGRETRVRPTSRYATALLQYLQSEKTINAADRANVNRSVPAIGQTFCGALSILGRPNEYNRTETRSSVHFQLVYRKTRTYVYVDGTPRNHNGLVTAVQD